MVDRRRRRVMVAVAILAALVAIGDAMGRSAAAEGPALALVARDLELAGRVAEALRPRYPQIRSVASVEEARRAAGVAGGPKRLIVVEAVREPGTTEVYGTELATCRLAATVQVLRLPAATIAFSHTEEATRPDCTEALDIAAAALVDELIRGLSELERPPREKGSDQLWVELPDDWPAAERDRLLTTLRDLPGVLRMAVDQDPHFLELEVFREPRALAAQMDRLEAVRVARFRGRRIVLRPESAAGEFAGAARKSASADRVAGSTGTGDPRRWALVVGISSFGDGAIPTLSYPVKDAENFARVLIDDARFPADQVKVLTDDLATTRRVKMELDYLARLTRPEDLFLFFISTHAVSGSFDTAGDAYLVTHDTESKSLYATGFPMRELVNALNRRIRARTVVGFLDACHTGQVLDSSAGEFPRVAEGVAPADAARQAISWSTQWEDLASKSLPAVPAPVLDELPAEAKRIVIISSSDGHQPSWESEKLGHGVFTYHLMSGLRETRGRILLSDLFERLEAAVRRSVLEERGRFQEPKMFVSKDADFWIGGESGDG